ncbi:carotenoid biosynthesis protein [Pedobacter sp. MW01-1-1]|uniref:carotenoid biosynthesis protein n=1 Tax=Pedobacter sp. MW01-1-1 TaxID=3383027 RepID=UPI003FED97A5
MSNSSTPDLKVKKFFALLIVLFSTITLTGLLIPTTQPYFIRLIPIHILTLFSILVLSYTGTMKRLLLFSVGVFVCGFLVDALGVHTGKIFGSFYYGDTLGYKIAAVPLLMGLHWVLLIFGAGQTMKALKIRDSKLASFLGALSLVVLDYFLEPVAMKLNYWQWDWHEVPVQNYIAWFFVSLIFLKFYYALGLKQQKYIGPTLFVTQLIFFVVLYLTISTNIFA